MNDIPIVGKTYDAFNDGKISESRRYQVTIKEVVPFSDIDDETLSLWKDEVEDCDFLYSKSTDFFVKAEPDEYGVVEVFVRTLNDGWFSMGFLLSGRLDIDGSLMAYLETQV
tara:strand:- start:22809 stop:23144 length:336 start_codon:yes stop_codon:yes gene_type:complete